MNTTARGSRRSNNQRRQAGPISGPSPLSSQSRRRSRSPDPQPAQQQGQHNLTRKPDVAHADQNKRKKPGNPFLPSSSSRPFLVAIDDANSDRGRKSKVKPRSQNRHLAENSPRVSTPRAPEAHGTSIKRERSKSRESHKLPSKGAASDAEGSARGAHGIIDAHADYSGPLTAAEFAKMKRELDVWKKLAQENKKTIKKQSKVVEELKQQDNTSRQKLKEYESQISKLQSKTKKSDEVC
ncbi:hypothetical protein J3R82DRAFT_8493 [Butyriboletus roseoflavus]|nr:hypothetical protein J3R82DRAFT_8493 [Butyriboletus roseoflavus]